MTYTNFLNVFQRTKTCNDLRFVYEGNPQNRTSFWTANSAAFYKRICTVTCKRVVQIKNSSVHITFVRTRVNGSKRGLVILLSVYNEIWKSVNAWKVLSLVFVPFFYLKIFPENTTGGRDWVQLRVISVIFASVMNNVISRGKRKWNGNGKKPSFLVLGNGPQLMEGCMSECKESSSRMGCSPWIMFYYVKLLL